MEEMVRMEPMEQMVLKVLVLLLIARRETAGLILTSTM
jgi:hypothetical protein